MKKIIMKQDNTAIKRVFKKGGAISFSLEKGSYAQPKGEERVTLIKPMPYAKEYFESKQPQKVIYL